MKFLRKAQLGWTYYRLTAARFAFWTGVLGLLFFAAIVMRSTPPPRELGYGELVRQIDADNVFSAAFVKSKDRTVIQGELRKSTRGFTTAISNDQMEMLTVHLRNRGVPTVTRTETQRDSLGYWGAIASVALFSVLYFLIVGDSIKRAKRSLVELKNKEAE